MKFIDLFAGIGGFRYGLQKVGAKSRGSTDGASGASQHGECPFRCVYSNEWDKYAAQIYRKHYGECDERDIRTVEPSEIPAHDLICAGFPCQSFSIAGKRKGFGDTRGTLFYEICRVARFHRTPYLLLENVKGLLNHDKGQTFSVILESLDELGYDLQWQVLNSKDFGVPQNRERVFIVGHLGKQSRPKVFPIGEGSKPVEVATCLDANYWKGPDNYGQKALVDDVKVRRLTPTECERLQGFPDGWTEGISDTQRYRCLGNAVTTNVVTAIGKRLCAPPTECERNDGRK